jgi:hypothetical protein
VRARRNDFYIPRLQNILEGVHAAFFAELCAAKRPQSLEAAAGTGTPARPKGLGMGRRSAGGLSMGGRGAAARDGAGAAGAAGVRDADVRVLLREAKARVLAGVRIVFSGVYRARCANWRRACARREGLLL